MTKQGTFTDNYPEYELLAKHLDPQFGSIYEYNLEGGYAGEDPQPWTARSGDAIRSYLLHELPDDVGVCLFGVDRPIDPAISPFRPSWS